MHSGELQEWITRFGMYFPDIRKAIDEQNPETRSAWAKEWLRILADVTPEEGRAAIQRMIDETEPPIAKWEIPQLAAKVRAHVRDIRLIAVERENKARLKQEAAEVAERRRYYQDAPRGGDLKQVMSGGVLRAAGLGPAFREIEERVANGEDRREVTREIAAQVRRGER